MKDFSLGIITIKSLCTLLQSTLPKLQGYIAVNLHVWWNSPQPVSVRLSIWRWEGIDGVKRLSYQSNFLFSNQSPCGLPPFPLVIAGICYCGRFEWEIVVNTNGNCTRQWEWSVVYATRCSATSNLQWDIHTCIQYPMLTAESRVRKDCAAWTTAVCVFDRWSTVPIAS